MLCRGHKLNQTRHADSICHSPEAAFVYLLRLARETNTPLKEIIKILDLDPAAIVTLNLAHRAYAPNKVWLA